MLRPRVPCPWSQLATRPRCDIITPSVTASPNHHHIALGPEHNSLHELLSYHHSRWSSYRLYDTCEKFQLDLKFTESNISHLVESLHLRADPNQGLGDTWHWTDGANLPNGERMSWALTGVTWDQCLSSRLGTLGQTNHTDIVTLWSGEVFTDIQFPDQCLASTFNFWKYLFQQRK